MLGSEIFTWITRVPGLGKSGEKRLCNCGLAEKEAFLVGDCAGLGGEAAIFPDAISSSERTGRSALVGVREFSRRGGLPGGVESLLASRLGEGMEQGGVFSGTSLLSWDRGAVR